MTANPRLPLPAASGGSVTKGIWFVFALGEKTIRAWGSGLSGLERVYVDDAVVSEQRSIGRSSTHKFALAGQSYVVVIKIISILKVKIECTLLRDGNAIGAYLASWRRPRIFTARRFLPFLAACTAAGIISGIFTSSIWPILGVVSIAWAAVAMSPWGGLGDFSVQEITPA
jgi:hypothetical protein